MKTKQILIACLLIATLNSFSQQPEWTIHRSGMTGWHYKDSTYTDSISRVIDDTTHYCKYPYHVKEVYEALPYDHVNDILEADNGDIYVATWDGGVSKFDGENWTIYNASNSELPGNWVNCLIQASNGDIYVGTGSGLAKYDGSSWMVYDTSNTALPSMWISSLIQTTNGDIYVGSSGGLTKFDGTSWSLLDTNNSDLPSNRIYPLLQTSNGDIYVGTSRGLVVIDDTTWTVYDTNNTTIPSMGIYSLLEATNGDIYVGTSWDGMAKFDGTNWTSFTTSNSGILSNNVRSIIQRSNGDICFGGSNQGISIYDGTNWSVYDTSNSELPLSNYYGDLLETKNGNLWIGTGNGLAVLDSNEWTVYTTSGMPKNHVYSLLQATNGAVFVGAQYGGIAKLENSNWTIYDSAHSTNAILQTQNGDMYYATHGGGLVKFDGSKWTRYNEANSELPSDYVKALIQTSNGDIYIGTLRGLAKFDGTNWTIYNTTNSGLPSNNIYSLLEANNGDIYIGTYFGGLAKFDGSRWTVYTTSNSGLPDGWVKKIIQSKNGDIYLAMYRYFAKFDGVNWTIYHPSDYGFDNDHVSTIMEARNGDLYIGSSSRQGLLKYDGINWTTFNTSNSGLPDNYVTSIMQAYNGDIYVGTDEGLGILHAGNEEAHHLSKAVISGVVYLDENKNGKRDFNEIGLKNHKIRLLPNDIYTFTNAFGEFSFQVDSGNYTVQYIPIENWYHTGDTTSVLVSIPISTEIIAITYRLHFGVYHINETTSLKTLLTYSPTRCGFTIPAYFDYSNIGPTIEDAIISLTPDEDIVFVNSFPKPDSASSDSSILYWHHSTLAPCQSAQIQLTLRMPGTNAMGDTLISYASILNDDSYIFTDTLNSVITCSYDPNDKLVSPAGVMKEHYTLMDEELTYTIRFQNTGTDTAFTVVVRDTIDTNLDMNTFTQLASSHDVITLFDTTGIVSFTFNNILLPDSNVNESGSHGFIKYSIKPKINLPENTVVENTGYIFFDFNPAIVTNTTLNTYVTEIPSSIATSTSVKTDNDKLIIYPNPTTGVFKVVVSGKDKGVRTKLTITDLTGKLILTKDLSFQDNSIIDLSNHSKGIYFIRIQDSERIINKKILFQ